MKCCTFVVPNTSFMGTVKIVLRKKKSQDGTFPIAIRITRNRKSSFIHTSQSVKESEWDDSKQRVRKSHPNSSRLNNLLIKKLSEANNKLLEMETDKNDITARAIKNSLKATGSSTFFAQAATYIDNLKKSGKFTRVSADQPRINRFREFLKGGDISFQDMNVSLLNRFKAYLKGTYNVSERTAVNYFVVIRSIFNQAINGNVTDKKYYPFGKDKIRIKFPDSIKIGLTPEEVKKIEDLKLEEGSAMNHTRNLWLFSFYFAGMRISDVLRLKWVDFQNERLHYAMGKNAKGGSLKIPEKAANILSQYQKQKNINGLVFPDLCMLNDLDDSYEVQKRISNAVHRLDKHLKEIAKLAKVNKKISMHIARHTFGNISGEKISLQMLQKLYRHSSITTTIGYQANFIHKDADDALDAVVGF